MKITIENIKTAIAAANAAYIARTPEADRNMIKGGDMQKDLAQAWAIASKVDNHVWGGIDAMGVGAQIIEGIKGATNTKKPMRILQAALFAQTTDGRYLKGSAKTFLLQFCALAACGAKTRSSLFFAATGKGDESTSDEISVSKSKLILRKFGGIGEGSESTQNSVSFSKGGIAETLGVAVKDKRTGMPAINLDNKVAQALDAIVKGMTDGKLALIHAQATERSK